MSKFSPRGSRSGNTIAPQPLQPYNSSADSHHNSWGGQQVDGVCVDVCVYVRIDNVFSDGHTHHKIHTHISARAGLACG